MNYQRGSIWRKWDLQVHTPYSYLCSQFGTDFDVYLQKLFKFAISKQIAAIGITDYFTIEGYKKIKSYLNDEEKLRQLFETEEIEKIKQILILPNIEFRLNKIVGGKRLEFHVLFSDSVSIKDIKEHFLDDINFVYQGVPFSSDDMSKLKIDNLAGLGATLKEQHDEFKGEQDVFVGMMNAVVDDNQICEILASNKFKGKYLIGLPSDQDLSQIDWNGQDHNVRKVLIQKANFLFASNKKTIAWALGEKHSNKQDFVNEFKSFKPCLHSSDAHNYDRLFEPDNKRYTWIKADPTFEGLMQVIHEPLERVFIGDEPEIFKRVRDNKTRYISSISFKKNPDSALRENWFENCKNILINPELSAIIGNKGSGKSAFSDTIGLLGNSRQQTYFSFLSKDKFCEPKEKKAENFTAGMSWEDGYLEEKLLSAIVHTDTENEMVAYIPQNYLERICSDEVEGNEFNKELKAVIFSHVDKAERLGCTSLDELISTITNEKKASIEIIKESIHKLNLEITALEKMLHPKYKLEIENKLTLRIAEKASFEKPPEVKKPDDASPERQAEIEKINSSIAIKQSEIKSYTASITKLQTEKVDLSKRINNANTLIQKLDNFKQQFDTFHEECVLLCTNLGVEFEKIAKLELNTADIKTIQKEALTKLAEVTNELSEDNKKGPVCELNQAKDILEELKAALDQDNKNYQKYLKELQEWKKQCDTIEGDKQNPEEGTIWYYKIILKRINKSIPDERQKLRAQRSTKIQAIYDKLDELKKDYEQLYASVKEFVKSAPFSDPDKSLLDFNVSIECKGFLKKFFDYIGQNKKGTFYGNVEGKAQLRTMLDVAEFNTCQGLEAFLESIERSLEKDKRSEGNDKERRVVEQLRKEVEMVDFYDYIYCLEYLMPEYNLQWSGKKLHQLSPGERGLVLLIFYLFIDKNDIPLVIDQPEENLDNESVYKILVSCIKEAKKRRQIIIVTHNPNLAVVCDAEQIIYSEIDKQNGNRITYTCGAIENPTINKKLIDVLEGTRPAFNNRDHKYYVES
ncbi:MAG: TrlF family AAA-like ATPase [Planctomycetota bacterium]|jgi:ABC-type lipoprotein export system ATPase subunit